MNTSDLFHKYALNESIDYKSLDEKVIKELLEQIINDKNSSMARETAILKEAGVEPLEGKLNYDGIKNGKFIEVKLRNLDTNRENQSKLNGEGSYSDYTWERYKKHSHDNPDLLVGGFIDGKLVYIFKFGYNDNSFQNRIKDRLTSFFGDINSERRPNHYLRSLSFTYNHYSSDAELIYIAPKDFLCNNKQYINKELFKRLMNESK